MVRVTPPKGFALVCSTDGSFKQLNLPGKTISCIDDPFTILLEEAFGLGTYAFGALADVPSETPSRNAFDIVILSKDNKVVDAAYGIPGQPLLLLRVGDPVFTWSNSEATKQSTVTVGFSFFENTTIVKALLISLPEGFVHNVETPAEVNNLNRRFPVATNWAQVERKDRIRVLLDNTREDIPIVPGAYGFSFSVLVPPEGSMPRSNVWFLSLCSNRQCWNKEESSALITFPFAGFSLGEVAPQVSVNLSNVATLFRSTKVLFAFALYVTCVLC